MPIITLLVTLAAVGISAIVENLQPKLPAMTKEQLGYHMIHARK